MKPWLTPMQQLAVCLIKSLMNHKCQAFCQSEEFSVDETSHCLCFYLKRRDVVCTMWRESEDGAGFEEFIAGLGIAVGQFTQMRSVTVDSEYRATGPGKLRVRVTIPGDLDHFKVGR